MGGNRGKGREEGRRACLYNRSHDLACIGAAWLSVTSLGVALAGVVWVDVAWLGTASCGLRSLNSISRGFVLLVVVFVSLGVNFPVISTCILHVYLLREV